jgi:hypothetical protein
MDQKAALRIEKLNYILGGAISAASFLLLPGHHALGILVGALISAINFTLIRGVVQKVMRAGGRGAGAAALFLPKMIGLLVAVALSVYLLPISPLMLAIGFSVFLLSIAVETIRFLFFGENGGTTTANH